MSKLMNAIDRTIETLTFVIFLAIVLVGTAQVFNRYFLNYSLSWSEEFQRYGQIWIVFLGIPIAYRRGMHIGLETLHGIMAVRGRRTFALAVDLLWIVLGGAILAGMWRLSVPLAFQTSPGMGLPMDWVYGGIDLGAAYIILVAIRRIARNLTGQDPELYADEPSIGEPIFEEKAP